MKSYFYSNVGKNIQYLKLQHGKTLEDVAPLIGLSRQSLSVRMHHPERFTLGEIDAIAQYFHVDSNLLIHGEMKL